jgi:hypothetical protein
MEGKTAYEATYREMVEALCLAASIARNGDRAPESHAQTAVQAVDALIALQAQRGAA